MHITEQAAPLLFFYNRDDTTARRFIWLRQMRDVKRRKNVRSTLFVAPSCRCGYKTFGAAKSKIFAFVKKKYLIITRCNVI
jgi:hypothetical protein